VTFSPRLSSLAICALLFSSVAAEDTLPVFTDVTEQAGITAKHSFGDFDLSNIVEGTGAGATFLDYDGDGHLDIYLVNGCWHEEVSDSRGRTLRGKLTNTLFHNKGDGTFADVTKTAGVGHQGFGAAASSADYDLDGDADLYVLNYGPNVFYRNNGDGTFTDVTEETGLGDPHWSLSGAWFDYDGDGDLDVYVGNYLQYDRGKFRDYYPAAGYPGPLSYAGQQDTMYRNNGDGTFTDVTQEAGFVNPDGRAMSATIADLNGDGKLDVYVANDAMENYFYRNLGEGRFVEDGLVTGLSFGEAGQGVSSMGPTTGDVDRDGRIDVYIPDMGYGCLMLNRGEFFEDWTARSRLAIVCGQYTGWGGALFDYDNDGYLDVFISNGNAHHEYSEEDVLMHNDGKGVFTDVARRSGQYFSEKYVGRGTAYGDYDNDGDLDLLVNNLNDVPRLLRNDGGNASHWLAVVPRLAGGKLDAVGARVSVTTGKLLQVRELNAVTGYLSQSDPRAYFGLGEADKVDRIEILWPNGKTATLSDVAADQILTVVQEDE
jgi:enediyne biosynthesis protein E4